MLVHKTCMEGLTASDVKKSSNFLLVEQIYVDSGMGVTPRTQVHVCD